MFKPIKYKTCKVQFLGAELKQDMIQAIANTSKERHNDNIICARATTECRTAKTLVVQLAKFGSKLLSSVF